MFVQRLKSRYIVYLCVQFETVWLTYLIIKYSFIVCSLLSTHIIILHMDCLGTQCGPVQSDSVCLLVRLFACALNYLSLLPFMALVLEKVDGVCAYCELLLF